MYGACPLPTHTSRHSRESFSVNLALRVWSCHSASCMAARNGRIGGHVIDLVALLEGCGLRQAGLCLQNWFGGRAIDPPAARESVRTSAPAASNRPLGFTLQGIDTCHPYLAQRGISPDTARLFGVGMYRGAGFLTGRCVVPIRDENSRLIAYAGRTVHGEPPKYLFPAGFRKSHVLFNLDRARHTGGCNVIVVEGFFDALKLHQAGHAVVALMGTSFSQRQSDLLAGYFSQVTLMLDGDPPGRRAVDLIAQFLPAKIIVAKVGLPPGVQPDQLSSAEISSWLARATVTL